MFLSTPWLPQMTLWNIRWGLRDLTPMISECPRELFYHISLTFNFHGWTKFTSKSSGIMFLSTPRLALMILCNIRWGLWDLTPMISQCLRELFYLISLTFNFHWWTKFTSKSPGIMFLWTCRLFLMIIYNIRCGLRDLTPKICKCPRYLFYLILLTFNFHGWTKFTSKSSGIMFLSTPKLSLMTLCNIRWGLRDLSPMISECPRELFYLILFTFNFHGWT